MKFDFSNLRGDVFGGITAGIVALPLALAFGVQSGLGAEAGLYGAIFISIFAALFGGTSTQISGPTGPMTVFTAAIFAGLVGDQSPDMILVRMLGIFVLAGIFQVFFGLIKIGGYIKYMPYPVVSGFMSGIGVIIILLQLFPAMGYKSPKKILDIVSGLGEPLSNPNWEALLLVALTIAIIYLFPRITKKVPGTLVALIVVSLIPQFIPMDVSVIGDIPKGFPKLRLDVLSNIELAMIGSLIIPALTLAALGSIDSLLTSVVADNLTKTKHNSNKELIGQGIGNAVAGIFGGIPGAGATMRTVVNIQSGGKTRISGVLAGVLLLVILLGAGTYASQIPSPVLAGILIVVGIGIIDYKGFRHIPLVPKADTVVMIIVLLTTVFVDLLQAVAIGMVMASLLFMKRMGDHTQDKTIGKKLKDLAAPTGFQKGDGLSEGLMDRIYVKNLDGPLFFGSASEFKDLMSKAKGHNIVILRMYKVPHMDQSGVYAFEDVLREMRSKDIEVYLTGLHSEVTNMLLAMDVIPDLVPESHLFTTFKGCLAHLREVEQAE